MVHACLLVVQVHPTERLKANGEGTPSRSGLIKWTNPRVRLTQYWSVCLKINPHHYKKKKKSTKKPTIKPPNQGITLIWQSAYISREKLQATKEAACKLLYSLAFIMPSIQSVTLIMLCIYVPPFIQEHQSPWKSMNTSPILCHPGRFHSLISKELKQQQSKHSSKTLWTL